MNTLSFLHMGQASRFLRSSDQMDGTASERAAIVHSIALSSDCAFSIKRLEAVAGERFSQWWIRNGRYGLVINLMKEWYEFMVMLRFAATACACNK